MPLPAAYYMNNQWLCDRQKPLTRRCNFCRLLPPTVSKLDGHRFYSTTQGGAHKQNSRLVGGGKSRDTSHFSHPEESCRMQVTEKLNKTKYGVYVYKSTL